MAIKFMKPADAFCFGKDVPSCGEVEFWVILKKLRNDKNGNLQYEATIVDLELLEMWMFDKPVAIDSFKFTGHSQTEEYEAEWALDEYLKLEKVLKRYESY